MKWEIKQAMIAIAKKMQRNVFTNFFPSVFFMVQNVKCVNSMQDI